MFSIFSRKTPAPSRTLDFIGIDMHSHLLPGIDDGSPNEETSIRFMEAMMELGYAGFYATPHVLGEVHPNTPATISEAHARLKTALEKAGMTPKIGFAAEYMADFDLEAKVQTPDLLHLPNKYVLIEMSYAVESPNLREIIFQLQTKGYKPILAHPERYPYYFHRFESYETLVDAGADLQLNILSLTGYYGKPSKIFAEKLIEANLVSWVGTDLHHDRHLEALRRLTTDKKVLQQLGKIKNLLNQTLPVPGFVTR